MATTAFGMGIDKPDVRFVIHHSVSKSMENLYQESGRAGRDDQVSHCIVFYRLADIFRQSSMVFTEQTGLENLYGIMAYCTDLTRFLTVDPILSEICSGTVFVSSKKNINPRKPALLGDFFGKCYNSV